MIGGLKGEVTHKDPAFVILNVAGVGYKVYVPIEVAGNVTLGDELSLWTHLSVRENALDLYGFDNMQTLRFFELLIGISGIGPKGALGILSVAPLETLKTAISSGETSYLTKVSGIGKKNAEKIVLELKDKITTVDDIDASGLKDESDALMALIALGYTQRDAREALKQVDKEVSGTNNKIKEALKILGKSS